ncbi:hypothetical protein BD408DRAFT_411827 [Parasitella parasitica]|nr:hypothetical protein BD408DRAFT_411827 [Parasitella parasitica]
MSHYQHVPFTSNLQMWSPASSSVSLDFNVTAFPYSTAASTHTAANYYHHEPLFYPAACIICGLFHHPVPHTMMNSAAEHARSVATAVATATSTITIITPAPSIKSLPIIPLERKKRKKCPRMTRKSKNRLFKYFKTTFRKLITFKIPLRKRYNIHPLKRHE